MGQEEKRKEVRMAFGYKRDRQVPKRRKKDPRGPNYIKPPPLLKQLKRETRIQQALHLDLSAARNQRLVFVRVLPA